MSNDASSTGSRRRKLKTMPQPATWTEFAWGHDREELKGLSRAAQVMLMTKTRAWREVVRPICEETDHKTRGKRGPVRRYSAEQLEICLLYGTAWGEHVPERVRDVLGSDREPGARELLGLDTTIPLLKGQKRLAGVPASNTLRRHRNRFTDELRSELWDKVYEDLLDLVLDEEALHEAMREIYMDGTSYYTHYTAPHYDKHTGELVNPQVFDNSNPKKPKRLSGFTAPEAGFRGSQDEQNHPAGDGWQAVFIVDSQGLPLSYAVDKINVSERAVAERAISRYAERVAPRLKLEDGDLSVLTADAGLSSPAISSQLHGAGVAPCIQKWAAWRGKAAHELDTPEKLAAAETELKKLRDEKAPKELIDARAKKIKATKELISARAVRRPIQHYPNWRVNDLYELFCVCGSGKVSKRAFRDERGYAVMSLEGRCENCGSCTIQAGRWRRSKNAGKSTGADGGSWFMRVHKGDNPSKTDWRLGNYLTFEEPEAVERGGKRFGRNEGFNGAIGKRFGVGREKSYHRTDGAVEAHIAQSLCLMLTLALEKTGALSPEAEVIPFAPRSGSPPGSAAQAA